MTTIFRHIVIAALSAGMLLFPQAMDAQARSGRGNHHGTQNVNSRSDNKKESANNSRGNAPAYGNFRPGQNSGQQQPTRPGNNQGTVRPGNSGNHNGHATTPRPPQPTNNWKPANNGHRPEHGMTPPPPPGRPGNVHRPVAPGPHWGAPPLRPYRPVVRPWHRPVPPPPSWRPRPYAPALSAILGITFGTALNISINSLVTSGYQIDGYANNAVYLRDINSYNYFWPDATLYYNNGGLSRSEFLYSTSYPDPMRYNALYSNFVGVYGLPVSYNNSGASLSATWYAPNHGYITLQYAPQYSLGGQMRYFTTLTLGL